MNLIPQDLPSALSSMSSMIGHDKDLKNLQNTEAAQQELSIQKSTDFTLYTAEGDKVTLSSFASLEASLSTYTSKGTMAGEGSQSDVEEFSMSMEFELQLSVEGDLNEQEIKDIRRAFTQMRKMVRNLLSGKTEKAMGRASKLMDFKSISGFEAVYQYSRTYSAGEALAEETMPMPGETSEQAATPPASPAITTALPTQPTVAPTPLSPPDPEPSGAVEEKAATSPPAESTEMPGTGPSLQIEIDHLVKKMASLVVESDVETGKLVEFTSQFLDHLSAKYSYENGESSFEFSLVRQIQLSFMQKFEAMPDAGEASTETEGSEEKAPQALTA